MAEDDNNLRVNMIKERFDDREDDPIIDNNDIVIVDDDNQLQGEKYKLPLWLDILSYMVYLALFGELGVWTRYYLRELLRSVGILPLAVNTLFHIDFSANMLGSFLMGWFGVVFKEDISNVSDYLAVGLSTGYLGSLTTFSGWNQNMIDNSHLVLAIGGFITGMILMLGSIVCGVQLAKWFRKSKLFERFEQRSGRIRWNFGCSNVRMRFILAMLVLVLFALWISSGILTWRELHYGGNSNFIWFSCLVSPLGVWARWYLARFNKHCLPLFSNKKNEPCLPLGTLTANIVAALLMAALARISKVVNTERCTLIVTGFQFGFLGCLSTVSTFVSELHKMGESDQTGEAVVYIAATILPSFLIGAVIYFFADSAWEKSLQVC